MDRDHRGRKRSAQFEHTIAVNDDGAGDPDCRGMTASPAAQTRGRPRASARARSSARRRPAAAGSRTRSRRPSPDPRSARCERAVRAGELGEREIVRRDEAHRAAREEPAHDRLRADPTVARVRPAGSRRGGRGTARRRDRRALQPRDLRKERPAAGSPGSAGRAGLERRAAGAGRTGAPASARTTFTWTVRR